MEVRELESHIGGLLIMEIARIPKETNTSAQDQTKMNGSMFFLLGFKEMEKCVIKTFAIIRLTLKRSFLMTIMTCFSKKSMNKNPSMRS